MRHPNWSIQHPNWAIWHSNQAKTRTSWAMPPHPNPCRCYNALYVQRRRPCNRVEHDPHWRENVEASQQGFHHLLPGQEGLFFSVNLKTFSTAARELNCFWLRRNIVDAMPLHWWCMYNCTYKYHKVCDSIKKGNQNLFLAQEVPTWKLETIQLHLKFYVPETHIMYFIRRCWFLKCSEEIM
jgi:hypothetical protein